MRHMNRFHSIISIILTLQLFLPLCATAQTTTTEPPMTIKSLADHLTRFGKAIPQEKVFVHMDNTCYFLGDTIWYAAYTRRTDKGLPSDVSRVLYVELYNQDGYLVERQLVEMEDGRGYGNFALADTLYGGFYELRAYTRWQLNWGQTQHPHTKYAEEWFFNKAMAREYYRDYEKLYSRVFPVYSKPQKPGEYSHDMTTRPLRRAYKEEDKSGLVLSFFPEGGWLVGGAPCRMAFEVATEEGECQTGQLVVNDGNGTIVAQGTTVSRGRGMVTFTPAAGASYTATFTADSGKTAKGEVKSVPADGVALSVLHEGDEWLINVNAQGQAAQQPLGMTIMHEGVVTFFEEITSSPAQIHYNPLLNREELGNGPGVHQVTVFDANGRVWADRLFFVTAPELTTPTMTVSGIKSQYAPYEEVNLEVTAPSLVGKARGGSCSLSVRDASMQDYLYDNGNILTEMLLSSEIRGFVPQPGYFFEADDEEHRTALDLLMMTQGWRRFDWKTMAMPKAFAINHPAEYTQILSGIVHKYTAQLRENAFGDQDLADHQAFMEAEAQTLEEQWAAADQQAEGGSVDNSDVFTQLVEDMKNFQPRKGERQTDGMAAERFYADEGALKREVLVHAEFVQPGSKEGILGDAVTDKGRFKMQVPDFQGHCLLFLGASDTTKWKGGRHQWIVMDEEKYPEFYVRLSFPYPRFVKPYDFYHTHFPTPPEGSVQTLDFIPEEGTMMNTLTVKARRRGLRAFDASKPAFVLDAVEAFNQVVDAGLSVAWYQGHSRFVLDIARTYIGDMNMERNYPVETRYNTKNNTFYHAAGVIDAYNKLYNLDQIYVYTDYSPRREGSKAFLQDNQPTVTIDLRRPQDHGMRVTYRDRYYALQGFNVPDEFYNPDYSQHPLPDGQADYRRTLYWNPELLLDDDGRAAISFFTGSKPTTITVEANGQAADGTILTN